MTKTSGDWGMEMATFSKLFRFHED